MGNRAALRHPERHRPRRARDVVIGVVRPTDVAGAYTDSLMGLMLHDRDHDGRVLDYRGRQTGPPIHTARNDVVHDFLRTSAEWLWFVDSDMTFAPDTLDRLLAVAAKGPRIVGGLCFSGGGGSTTKPTVYVFHREDGDALSVVPEQLLYYPADRVIEVDATGTGSLLVHRCVYESILADATSPTPWFEFANVCGLPWGEDLVFCLRAQAHGFQCYVDTSVKHGHRKAYTLGEDQFIAQMDKVNASQGEGEHTYTQAEWEALVGSL